MDTRKTRVSIDYVKCPPCSGIICVGACPQGTLELSKNKKPEITDQATCNQCEVCASLCPTKAITIHRTKPSKQ